MMPSDGRDDADIGTSIAAARFTLFGSEQPDGYRPRWLLFDDAWYAARYHVAEPRSFYRAIGARLRRSPNRLFDEHWYVAAYADVAADIRARRIVSGFEHYCGGGYHDRSPNCHFDEAHYRRANSSLFRKGGPVERRGYANGYDHYLAEGAFGGRQPSRYFDESVWRMFRAPALDGEGRTPLEHYLAECETLPPGACVTRTSWYFDPEWYAARYGEDVRSGEWSSPLAHYLGNPTPTLFDPNAQFSEQRYAEAYPDVAAAVHSGIHRSCYAHFVDHGAAEGRRPSPDIDLARFADARVKAEVEGGLYPDAFAFYVASEMDETRIDDRGAMQDGMPPTERQAKLLFALNARMAAAVMVRHPVDFSLPAGTIPAVSVIMVLHNQFSFTMAALASLRQQGEAIELILVDSGSSDETIRIERHVHGARVLRLGGNLGFIAGCNAGLAEARADAVLYMNNDVVLGPGAIRAALQRLARRPDAGAVGGKIVRPHGKLQEAGCILWRDGSTTGYLRDRAPDSPEANFVREVDFCSGAFLMVRAALAHALGGFDPAFRPAYYEETDFCVRLRQSGHVVLYDPDVLVHHYEYGSSDAARAVKLMEKSRAVFSQRHGEVLRFQYNYRGTEYVRARGSRRGQRRILVVEDRIPRRKLGAGYVRTNDIVRTMAELDYAVTVFPVDREPEAPASAREDFPDGVELMHDRSAATVAAFLAERSGMYDLVWVGRTRNLQTLLPQLAAASGDIPDFGMILDTEAVAAPRMIAKHALVGSGAAETGLPLGEALEQELACARFCQRIVAVNERDAAYIRLGGHAFVDVLGHMAAPRPTPRSFAERRGLLFVGALHHQDAPNFDSLLWFTREVLPAVAEALGAQGRLTIAGHVAAGIEMAPFAGDPRIDLLGEVDDLTGLYDSHRVFVAPTRYAGGIPFKVHEAAAFGLPTVATSLLRGQLGWSDGSEILDGGDADPAAFARQVIRLDGDAALWQHLRDTALERLVAENGEAQFRATLAGILEATLKRR